MGVLRWRHPDVQGSGKCKEGWSGTARRCLRDHCTQWVWLPGLSVHLSLLIPLLIWRLQLESFEVPLEIEHLRDAGRRFPGIFIRAPVSSFPSLFLDMHLKPSRSFFHSVPPRPTRQLKLYPGYPKISSHQTCENMPPPGR
jgi:hypothetical protein